MGGDGSLPPVDPQGLGNIGVGDQSVDDVLANATPEQQTLFETAVLGNAVLAIAPMIYGQISSQQSLSDQIREDLGLE